VTSPWSWPGLRGLGAGSLPETLESDRAVWGKVHGSASDFRWIAATPEIHPAEQRLEREIGVGPDEEVPGRFPLWRALGERHLAVSCSPARGMDAAGRSGSLVKQVIRWRSDGDLPAALGALLLLPHAEDSDDSLWFDQDPEPWSDPAFVLSLDPANERPVEASPDELSRAIEKGIEGLRRSVAPGDLAAFYAEVLGGTRPAILRSAAGPIGPEALAALLLPLPPRDGDQLSLAGWVPSGRARAETLAERWDGVVLSPRATLDGERRERELSDELRDRGRALADALLRADPDGLPGGGGDGPELAGGEDGEPPIRLALWGPSAAGKTVLLAQLFLASDADPQDWQVWPTEEIVSFSRSMRARIDVSNSFPPPTNADADAERLSYRFRNQERGLEAVLALEDRAGAHWEELRDKPLENLAEADGLLFLIDPFRDRAHLDAEIQNTIVRLAVRRNGRPDRRPVAVCLSKADVLIESAEDLRLAREEPDRFVRRFIGPELLASLDKYYETWRLFPLSAIGARMRWGTVEPTVFYDEQLEPRIQPGGRPIHLLAPFSWLLDQASDRAAEGREAAAHEGRT
jgi:hypothetical protein